MYPINQEQVGAKSISHVIWICQLAVSSVFTVHEVLFQFVFSAVCTIERIHWCLVM